jgi:hypothetical protein
MVCAVRLAIKVVAAVQPRKYADGVRYMDAQRVSATYFYLRRHTA